MRLSWRVSQAPEAIAQGQVHVWRVCLDAPSDRIQRLEALLSPDERDRAHRFHFQHHRDRFIVARGLLRTLLSHYTSTSPQELQFSYTLYGKPRLEGARLQFNLSHSGDLALYAITRGREVGVDIELVRSDLEHSGIAEHFFSPREVAALRSLPSHLIPDGFYACWTRKEAYVKARGEGLSLPLDQFDVSLSPGAPAALLRNDREPAEVNRWRLVALDPGPGYAAALAVEGPDWELACWEWPNA